ncbi:proline--tRNA ligase [Svornostia abyssi]|uniref:Proline--tRNA ligase n=1 Tax=Svornostia abyssi TaxID=2898438 RepID=A0ABY5PD30_9ACTN|nr:proline--tRNA ligase [Parviterribacteraceae bacterium J379]
MTRLSHLLLPTERQAPADAEAVSHKLMVRAGLIRQLGAGLWSWLPAGWKTHEKAVQIIREEMNAVGGQEMLMPVMLPRELWKRTGRDQIDELFKLEDRKGSELVLAMTHEEAVTTHVAQVVRSYRDLPLILYHFQTKERDEPRPRAGALRTREFIMKDAYSFDRDEEGLAVAYDRIAAAYDRIFDRTGLRWYSVESDVGMMGGSGAHEYMAPCAAGENEVALAPGYAANVEVASADAQPVDLPAPLPTPERVHTPGATTVEDVTRMLHVPAGALLKAYPVHADGRGLVLVLVRGDHRVNEIKLQNALGTTFRAAHEDEIRERIGPPGYIGPVGANVPILLDEAVADGGYVTGANDPDHHLRGVEPGRDFPFERVDVRTVEAGDTVNGHAITIEPAIEIGNIFKLGTRYSEPLGATYLDEHGKEQLVVMGSYGIGPARIVAAAIEQYADEQGISWPRALAPWDIEVIGIGKGDTPEKQAAAALYDELRAAGFDVLLDDRDAGPGEKFADAELLGLPLRLTVGKRGLEAGTAEAKIRRGLVDVDGGVPLQGAADTVKALWDTLP